MSSGAWLERLIIASARRRSAGSGSTLLYHFDQADGDVGITDSSGSGNNGTGVAGTAEVDTSTSAFGSGSLYCNSTRVTVPYFAGLSHGSGDWTYEGWIKQDPSNATATSGGIFSRRVGSGDGAPIELNFQSATQLRLLIANAVDNSPWAHVQDWTLGSAISTSVFKHFAVVKSGSSISLYWEGTLCGSPITQAALAHSTVDLFIGSGGNGVFRGWIDDFRLSQTAVYTSNFTPTGPLT